MIVELASSWEEQSPAQVAGPCEHRNVAKDGSVICAKIVEGDNQVSPNVCRTCPFTAIGCGHLRFSLVQTSPTPIVVRFNGRTEIWDDEPPQLRFERAACAEKVIPIQHPSTCAACAMRQPLQAPEGAQARRVRRSHAAAKVVPFPGREAAVATG